MADILSRDITGHCEGECKDCVRESEAHRQKKIAESKFESSDSFFYPKSVRSLGSKTEYQKKTPADLNIV
ncbi:MAG: hypothetical protein PVJ54_04640 [Desulfobacterales bacterium]|jgi:hypothetical protein